MTDIDPDGLQRLWKPDRLAYIKGENRPDSDDADDCPFCRAPQVSDEEGHIVARGEHTYCLLNLYPYNPGHLMVCTYRHVASYLDLTSDERHEMSDLTVQAMNALRVGFEPHGFNLGMNQGHIGGAGIAAHIHQHVVPRWGGDTNFMPVIAHTKVIPQSLADTRSVLADAWKKA